jgi:hypothetical protein
MGKLGLSANHVPSFFALLISTGALVSFNKFIDFYMSLRMSLVTLRNAYQGSAIILQYVKERNESKIAGNIFLYQ